MAAQESPAFEKGKPRTARHCAGIYPSRKATQIHPVDINIIRS